MRSDSEIKRDVEEELRWDPDINQPSTQTCCSLLQARHLVQPGMHSTDNVQSRLQRFNQKRNPTLTDGPTDVGNANDQRARAASMRFLRGQPGQTRGDGRSFAGPFTRTAVGSPVTQPERGLGIGGLSRIAEKQKVGFRQIHSSRCSNRDGRWIHELRCDCLSDSSEGVAHLHTQLAWTNQRLMRSERRITCYGNPALVREIVAVKIHFELVAREA